MKVSRKLYASITAMAISFYAQAYPGESIVLDPATGNYTVTYVGNPNSAELSQTIFVPSTKIDPAIRSSFRLGERGIITYRYTVSNGATAKQAIVDVVLQHISNPIIGEIPFPTTPNETQAAYDAYNAAAKAATASPTNWHGGIARDLFQVDWGPDPAKFNNGGIRAGNRLSGFGFNSLDLPSVGSSWMAGRVEDSEIFGFPDDGPLEDSAILAQLNQLRDNDFITRNAAVPTIPVPDPYDAATLLERIQTQMHTWVDKKLLDATFSSQLDRYFQSAISAYRLNQSKVGRKQIQVMRELLKKEHHDADREDDNDDRGEKGDREDKNKPVLIDKLAARVLDFDLKYVTRRMGGDRDD